MQMQERVQQLSSSAASSAAAMSWQAELASCILILHKVSLMDDDVSTPTLILLFEDPAFAKLAPHSAQVKRARVRLQQLRTEHSAALAGIDLAVGSEEFQVFLAAFVKHKVLSLQEELVAKAVSYAHLQALMPALAERATEQARIVRSIQRVVCVIDEKAAALQGWLLGAFVAAELLPASLAELKEGCSEWDFKQFHRGVFPWQHSQAMMDGRSEFETLTELEQRIAEHQRAKEELSLVQEEKRSTLQLYAQQQSAVSEALTIAWESAADGSSLQYESSATTFVKRCQSARAARKQAGICILLEERLQRVQALKAHAERAFALSSSGSLAEALTESAMHSGVPNLEMDADSDSDMDI